MKEIKHNDLVVIIAELTDAIKHVNRFDEELQQRYHLRCSRECIDNALTEINRLIEGEWSKQ